MDGELIILGCGGSSAVPTIGNWWGACDPNEPRNIRTRPSIALKTEKSLVIVDTGPDFRTQMNRENLGAPDAVIITHTHFDHINGIDELRTFQRLKKGKIFPVYGFADTLEILQKNIGYMFMSSENGFYPAVCEAMNLKPYKSITIADIPMMPFEQEHGAIMSLGLRVGNVAYCTDVKRLNDQSMQILKGVETLIIDAGGHYSETNPVHMSIREIIALNETVDAKKIYLTHMPPSMDYQTLAKELPDNFAPAHDGLVIGFTCD